MSEQWYYDFKNPSEFLKKELIRLGAPTFMFRYVHGIINTKVSMFSYKGKLPADLTSQIIECALLFNNHLCFVNAKEYGGWVLGRYMDGGDYNLYWKPNTVNVNALNGSNLGTFNYSDIIPVRDNRMDIIPFLYVSEYIQKIMSIEATEDKILTIASLPVGIIANKKQATALKQVAKQLGTANPFIVGDDKLIDEVKQFDITVPINPLDIYELKKKYLNECMSSMGIYSVEEKRERIVTQELVNQNDYTDFIYTGMVNERKEFIRKLNELGGFNIELVESYEENYKDSVEEKADLAAAVLEAQAKAIKKVDPNAEIGGGNPVTLKKNA